MAALPGSDGILIWARLLSGTGLTLTGASQLRMGVTLRRQERRRLLQTVATAISALERRQRER